MSFFSQESKSKEGSVDSTPNETSSSTLPPTIMQIGVSTGSHPTHRLVPSVTITENTGEVFAVRFSPDGRFLATGSSDGSIRVFNIATGRLSYNLQGGSQAAMPTMCIRWRPVGTSEFNKTRNVLIAANASGIIQHWHVTSGKLLHTTKCGDEKNQIFCIDYRPDGAQFAVAGQDKQIHVYDESTKNEITVLSGGNGYSANSTPGHSNRIFALKYHPTDPNIIVTGGWDNTVQIWDVSLGYAIRSLFGPHISGEAIDIYEDLILCGSYRPENQLELWKLDNGEKAETIPWSSSSSSTTASCTLFCAQFSKHIGPKFIGAGGSGSNECKIFDYSDGNKLVGTVTGLSKAVFTLDWSATNAKFAIAGGDNTVRIIDVVNMEAPDTDGQDGN